MSVLKNNRNISRFEFEHTFQELYKFSMERTSSVAKRREKWLCNNIDTLMNDVCNDIMELNEGYFPKNIGKEDLVRRSLYRLTELEKWLFVLWNIEQYPTKKMVQWVELVNSEIKLLNRMLEGDKIKNSIMILDWNTINSVKFLSNMSKLHRYIHGKVINARNRYDDTAGSMLIRLADDAFYSIICANKKIPTTKKEYKERRKLVSNAISCLHKMQRQTIFYFNLMQYSENTLREWSDLITSEIKLLYALNKSDRERFSQLT